MQSFTCHYGTHVPTVYSAPEIVGQPPTVESDIYSVGMGHSLLMMMMCAGSVLWSLLTRQYPLDHVTMEVLQVLRAVGEGLRPPIPTWCPPSLAAIIKRCWEHGVCLLMCVVMIDAVRSCKQTVTANCDGGIISVWYVTWGC